MKVLVNNKETDFQGATITDLVQTLGLPPKGVAIALHNRIIPRAQWDCQTLNEGDSLIIIKAACGG